MTKFALGLITASLFFAVAAQSQDGETNLDVQELADGVYMLSSGGAGNLGVSIGEDGTFMVDDKLAENGTLILETLESLGGSVPAYLANTHHHFDHTGGNQFFGEKGSIIVAHKNLRKRLKVGYSVKAFSAEIAAAPKSALPTLTYGEGMQLHLNNEDIHLIHVASAHTDNDTLVYFKNANVIHTGDTMFNGFFPFIDTFGGGSLPGVIDALKKVAELADDNTKVIPGHGPLAAKSDVVITIEMLSLANKRLSRLKADGKTKEDAIAAKPLADIEEKWGGVMFSADQWIGLVWPSVES